MHYSLQHLKRAALALISVAALSACQVSTSSASGGTREFQQTTPTAFASAMSDICAASVPNMNMARSQLRANGYSLLGQSGGSTIYTKGAGQPIVSLSRGDTTLICTVSALNPPGFQRQVVNTLTSTYGFTESGSFLSKNGVAGTWTVDTLPEGQVIAFALIKLSN